MIRIVPLNPTLILGSGIHRPVFGDTEHSASRPLYDWQYLVGQVAATMQVAIPDKVMSPVQRWNMLVLRAAKEGFCEHAGVWRAPFSCHTHFIEKDARRCVAAVLNEARRAAAHYPESFSAQMPLHDFWGALISLNFDAAWLPQSARMKAQARTPLGLPTSKIDQREKRRLTTSVLISGVEG